MQVEALFVSGKQETKSAEEASETQIATRRLCAVLYREYSMKHGEQVGMWSMRSGGNSATDGLRRVRSFKVCDAGHPIRRGLSHSAASDPRREETFSSETGVWAVHSIPFVFCAL